MTVTTFPLNPRTALSDLIAKVFSAPFAKTFSAPLGGAAAAAIPWYLSGGIAAANCIAAYDAKNAASLAASYVNLTGNAAYDLTAGTAPAWSAGVGHGFVAANSTYLKTGIIPGDSWSMIVRASNITAVAAGMVGMFNDVGGSSTFLIQTTTGALWNYYHGSASAKAVAHGGVMSGILAISQKNIYQYSTSVSDVIAAGNGTATWRQIFIGCFNYQNGTPLTYATFTGVAYAFYNIAIDSSIVALTTAMAAL